MFVAVVAVVSGVILLAVAADHFVLGAARVALGLRVPALVVGVVVVGFGTSAPELLVSALAVVGDEPDVAVGNVIGSNIANLTLLLGVGAVLLPLAVESRTVRVEAPLAVGAVGAFALALSVGGLSRVDGILLAVGMVAVLGIVVRRSPSDPLAGQTEELADVRTHSTPVEVARTVAGLVGTIGGAQLLLWGALDLADRAGLGEGFVGATMVAVGTSLPELVTVVQSARRGEPDLIVGNLLGSNLFNALTVGGVVGIVGATDLSASRLTTVAAPVSVGAALLAFAFMRSGRVVTRREGAALVVAYGASVPFLA